MKKGFVSGFIAVVGRPNVGKSTFLNRVLEYKISITTPKPQTTRDRILGIRNDEDSQIIFFDTPGIHSPHKALNKYMVEKAASTIEETDLILVMADHTDTLQDIELVSEYLKKSHKKAILVLNKTDLISKDLAKSRLEELGKSYPFNAKFGVSSLTGEGLDTLLAYLKNVLPEGPCYFPDDIISDMPLRFLCKEIIREKIFTLTQKEIPYAVAVEIEEFREGNPSLIRASIHVERQSQKGIVIGKGGKMLKEIGTQARIEMETILECRVFLELFVKVTKDWTKDPKELKRLGYV